MAKDSVKIQIWTTFKYKEELDEFCKKYGFSYASLARVGMKVVMNMMDNPIQPNVTVITTDTRHLVESARQKEIWERAKRR